MRPAGFATPGISGIVRVRPREGESDMRWELPQAIDFRFGMEITLYIARR
jgi:coenzyme PQQ precursor peptide PqqA